MDPANMSADTWDRYAKRGIYHDEDEEICEACQNEYDRCICIDDLEE